MKDAHVTIYDVAAKAGVSPATASRALAGLSVHKANLQAVEKAAADLGYIPNEAARSLRVTRTMTVGMVYNQLTSSIGMELLDSLTSALDKMGYSLLVSTAQGDAERYDQLVRRLLERRVDALICVNAHGHSKALDRFRAAGLPAIAMITKADGFADLPLISNKIEAAALDCMADLTALGHKRIGVIMPERQINLMNDVLRATGGQAVRLTGARTEDDQLDAPALLDQVAAMHDAPTVLIGLHNEVSAVLTAADARGLSVPDDLSLVAVRDRAQSMQGPRIPLSILYFHPPLVGERTGDILKAWLEEKIPWTEDVRVETGQWIDRGSIAAPPRR